MNKVSPAEYQSSAASIAHIPHVPTNLTSQRNDINSDFTKICKICLEEEISNLEGWLQMNDQQTNGMQLMVPCECSGSVGFVHEKCIRTWIQKQILKNGKKQAICQICKSQIHFKIKKINYCDFTFRNLALISGCNILSAIVQIFLLIVTTITFRYSLSLSDSSLLRYVLIILICIISLALGLTLFLMFKQSFIRKKRVIGHIFSIQQSQQLGLREVRLKKQSNLPKMSSKLPDRHVIRKTGNVNRVSNTHQLIRRRKTSNALLIEINPLPPFSSL